MKLSELNNIFCASNPAKMLDALWQLLRDDIDALSDVTVFLPSARAVRATEKFLVGKIGRAVILPQLIPMGQGTEDDDVYDGNTATNIVSNTERVLVLAKLLSADASIKTISNALPLASDLVRMQDYLEKENVGTDIDWMSLVDERYTEHFRKKAEFLSLADSVMSKIFPGKITAAAALKSDIANWRKSLVSRRRVIVCATTVSIPMQSDLMTEIANMPHGRIILSGDVRHKTGIINECDPYASELKFLGRIGVTPSDVSLIDVGPSNMEFFNAAFDNKKSEIKNYNPATRIDCARESEEAEVVAEIAARANTDNKSVLVITPDSAGNQRIAAAFERRNLTADFSGGLSGAMTFTGRAILNALDDLIENKNKIDIKNLFEFIESLNIEFCETDGQIIEKISDVSDILVRNGIVLTIFDARAIIKSALDEITIRPQMSDDIKINVVSNIQSRMQTADIVILTGLNEGMFPGTGYENAWLPRRISDTIGLPSRDKKVALMALDFMTLSCADNVYWMRSKTAGGTSTTESRFLSRVDVMDKSKVRNHKPVAPAVGGGGSEILQTVRGLDNITYAPLSNTAPMPPADRTDVFVTDLEFLIHNPYAYYAKHILKLRPRDDYWAEPDVRDFGNIVHKVIEETVDKRQDTSDIVARLDKYAKEILEPGSVIFHFWHKRFTEIASAVQKLSEIKNAQCEIELQTIISGRRVRARADMVYDNTVLDIKTGTVPNRAQLEAGNMPQLPLEAYMRGASVMRFLQLKNNDIKLIEYSGDLAKTMIDNTVQKVSELFGRYSHDFEPYEYYETSDAKYKAWDDLKRLDS